MKKITFLILVVLVSSSFTQNSNDFDSILKAISKEYNTKNTQALFDLFTQELQIKFPLDKLKTFISDSHLQNGKMGESSFLMDEDGDKRFLIEFDNSTLIMVLGLTPEHKISKFAFEEY